jgi:hypothetical protein
VSAANRRQNEGFTGAIGARLERITIQGVRDAPPGQPAAGIDVEPGTRDRPAADLHISIPASWRRSSQATTNCERSTKT